MPNGRGHDRDRTYCYAVRLGIIDKFVPVECRVAFGCSAVVVSLHTSSRIEAERLEKQHDVEFERRLREAREVSDPEAVATRIADSVRLEIGTVNPYRHATRALAEAPLTDEGRAIAAELIGQRLEQRFGRQGDINGLLAEIGDLIAPLSRGAIQQCRAGILSVIRHQAGAATETPLAADTGTYTLGWAYDRWLRAKDGDRTPQTIETAARHWKAFVEHAEIGMLGQVKRWHVVTWRDSLVDEGKLASKSINQRVQLVSAILRADWRDAEMAQPDLKAIPLPEPDDSGRGAWSQAEILTALRNLEPRSWSAWLYLIGLTTSVRFGEPVAAQVGWYDPTGFIHVRERSKTKAGKLHCLPIIECLRKPLANHVASRQAEGCLFDAPRPTDPKVNISKVASQWFQRFFDRNGIDRVFHELRDTWIEEARHSSVERDIWEIISGHSAATMSDRYGGKKPDVLAAANEEICKFLTSDAEIKAAMLRLVS